MRRIFVVAVTDSAAIIDPSATLVSCDDATGDQLCRFGRPSVSPDGSSIIVSRHPVPAGGFNSAAGPGTLLLLGADGSNPHMLAQLTASDTQPAFLPGGQGIVFAGRQTLNTPSQLYEANLDGIGLRQLTVRGGSWAAPCASGAIVFQRGTDVWLIPAHGRHWTRLVHGGSHPDCAPNSRQRTYDVLQADGSINELDVSDLSGRVRTRRVVAGQSGGSIGSDAEQSITQYVGW